jgi:hypothetical protein
VPCGCAFLGIGVDDNDPFSVLLRSNGSMDGKRRLAAPALLTHKRHSLHETSVARHHQAVKVERHNVVASQRHDVGDGRVQDEG